MGTPLYLPDLYDPPEPLEFATPFPLYSIEGTGSFAAIRGEVMRASQGAKHLEGRRVVDVLRECLEMEVEVLCVEERTKVWRKWSPRRGFP